MSPIRQGEVRDYAGGRVVVLSNDAVCETAYPLVAPLIRRSAGDLFPYVIATAEADPIRGAINVALLTFANPDRLAEQEAVCTLTGATLARLLDAVRALFDQE